MIKKASTAIRIIDTFGVPQYLWDSHVIRRLENKQSVFRILAGAFRGLCGCQNNVRRTIVCLGSTFDCPDISPGAFVVTGSPRYNGHLELVYYARQGHAFYLDRFFVRARAPKTYNGDSSAIVAIAMHR